MVLLAKTFHEKCWPPQARTAVHDVTVHMLLPLRHLRYLLHYLTFDYFHESVDMHLLVIVMMCRLRLT